MDFFTVPTVRVLFVFVVLSHDRRRVVHFNVTEHPTEEWTAQQIREAFPWDQAPRYLIRDRDATGRRTVVSLPLLRWVACTIDTNGAPLSRLAIPSLFCLCPRLDSTWLSFSAKSKPPHPRGGPLGAMNRPAKVHFSIPVNPCDVKRRLTRVGMALISRSSSVRPEFSVMTGFTG